MKKQDFSITFTASKSPEEVFDAINNVRGWWSGQIDGEAAGPGAEFSYRYRDLHRSRQRVTGFIRGKRIVWRVVDADLSFVEKRGEWAGTDIVFDIAEKDGGTEVRFTHVGLTPQCECHDACSSGWGTLLTGNLRRLISTGQPQSDAFAAA